MPSPTKIQVEAEAPSPPSPPPPPPTAPSATWFCKACNRKGDPSQGRALKACSRCRLARYCHIDCQRRDFAAHKKECKRFCTLRCALRQSTASFESHVDTRVSVHPRNLFEEARGRFYDVPGAREHCRKLAELGHELEEFAKTYPVVPLLEKSLAYRLQLLRLNTNDNMGMSELVPFTLLRLRLDGRCVAFIAHWLRVITGGPDPPSQHETPQRDDWLYGEADPCDDVFPQVGMPPEDAPVPLLIALCIVKLRLVANMEDGESFREQQRLADAYLHALHRRNDSLLPALINPAPLRERQAPVLKKIGGPSESYFALLSCYDLFVAVPGAVDRLIRRFGPDPQYDCEMHMW